MVPYYILVYSILFVCLYWFICLLVDWLIIYIHSHSFMFIIMFIYLFMFNYIYLFTYLYLLRYIYSCTLIFNHIHYQKSTFINFISFFQRSGTTIFLFLEPRLSPITVKKIKNQPGSFCNNHNFLTRTQSCNFILMHKMKLQLWRVSKQNVLSEPDSKKHIDESVDTDLYRIHPIVSRVL